MQHISIFVSSTFKDMMYERDILRSYVLPELVHYFSPKDIDVELIDLRWGIVVEDNEESIEKKILKCCLETIDVCKPFFIGFLGHRYGWIPPQDSEAQYANGEESITHIEIQHGIFDNHNFCRSLVFKRDFGSYRNLAKDELTNYVDADETLKKKSKQQMMDLVRAYDNYSLSQNIVDYSIDVTNPTKSEIFVLTQLLFTNLKRIIEEELSLCQDFVTNHTGDLFLKNYDLPTSLYEQVLKNVKDGKHSIIYGNKGAGKTSISLYLYKHLRNINSINCFFFSTDFQNSGGTRLLDNIKIWSESLYGTSLNLLQTLPEEWKRFKQIHYMQSKPSLIILDGYDYVKELENSNVFLFPSNGIVFIITSSSSLPKWEKCFHLSGLNIPLFSEDSARKYIERIIIQSNRKQLPLDIFNAFLEYRQIGEKLYSPSDLAILTSYVLSLDKNDYDKITKTKQTSNEKALYDYIRIIIKEMPLDSKLRSKFIITKLLQHFTKEELESLVYIACSLTGLAESQLSQLVPSYNAISFFLLRNYLRPYLPSNYYGSKWKFNNSDLIDAIKCFVCDDVSKCYYKMSFLDSFSDEERFYYGLYGYNMEVISLLYSNVNESYGTPNITYISFLQSFFEKKDNVVWFISSLSKIDQIMIEKVVSNLVFVFLNYAGQNPKIDTLYLIETLLNTIISDEIPLSEQNHFYFLTVLCLAHFEESTNRKSYYDYENERNYLCNAQEYYLQSGLDMPSLENRIKRLLSLLERKIINY